MKAIAAHMTECLDCPWGKKHPTGMACSHPRWNEHNTFLDSGTAPVAENPNPLDWRCPLPTRATVAADLLLALAEQMPIADDFVRDAFAGASVDVDAVVSRAAELVDVAEIARQASEIVFENFGGLVAGKKLDGLRAWLAGEIAKLPPASQSGVFSASDDARRQTLQEILAFVEPADDIAAPPDGDLRKEGGDPWSKEEDIPF